MRCRAQSGNKSAQLPVHVSISLAFELWRRSDNALLWRLSALLWHSQVLGARRGREPRKNWPMR
eukprot:3115455-Pyramimonas_sp.AAC.1